MARTVDPATCFRTFALPRLLFVPTFAQRQAAVALCAVAWNIALQATEEACNEAIRIESTDPARQASLSGLAHLKRRYFSWVYVPIQSATLHERSNGDLLVVVARSSTRLFEIASAPGIDHLPRLLDVLETASLQAKGLAKLADQMRGQDRELDDIGATRLRNACMVQVAELQTYRMMFSRWQHQDGHAEWAEQLARGLEWVDQVEQASRTYLEAVQTHD